MPPRTIAEIAGHRRILWRMTAREFRSRYAGSLMGVFWTVINPLLLLMVFSLVGIVVIKAKFGQNAGQSALYIFCGILPWLAFQDGVARAGTSMMENRNLMTRAMFPPSVIPICPALSAAASQLIGTAFLMGLAFTIVAAPGPALLSFPLIFALQILFTAGLALALAAAAVYVKDINHVMPVLLLVWMFATPIFYQAEALPETLRTIVGLNPLALLIESYRRVILEAAWPEGSALTKLAVFAAAALFLGELVFSRLRGGMADRL